MIKELKKDFGKTWDLLQLETQKFLSTAMVCYLTSKAMPVQYTGNIDFSVCITQLFKAVERELAKYLYTGYIIYLNKNHISADCFSSKRSFIVATNEGLKYCDPYDVEHFTLGGLPYIIGLEKIVDPMSGENISDIDITMFNYADSIFAEDAFGPFLRERAIIDYLVSFVTEIKSMVDSFRNPAAHADYMSDQKAELCIDYVIKSKKLIRKFIEKLKPEVVNKKQGLNDI